MPTSLSGLRPDIVGLYKSGLSTRDVADALGVSKTGVSKIIKKEGAARGNLDWQKDARRMKSSVNKSAATRRGVPQGKSRVHQIDCKLFSNLSDPIQAYLLGVVVTDGSVGARNVSMMVAQKDLDWMVLISEYLNIPLGIDKRGYPYWGLNSVEIVSTLESLGVGRRKTENPTKVVIPGQKLDFIRGLIDGDGCIGVKNGYPYLSFCGTNLQLVELVKDLCCSYGSKVNVSLANGWKSQSYKLPFYSVAAAGQPVASLLHDVYYDGCFAMPRKLKKAQEGMKWRRSESWEKKRSHS